MGAPYGSRSLAAKHGREVDAAEEALVAQAVGMRGVARRVGRPMASRVAGVLLKLLDDA